MFEWYDKQIPDYYPTMYMDGYTPEQILHAARRGMMQRHRERNAEQAVKTLVEAALRDVFKDFK
ncbi:MAG: hypothetical protein IJN20_05320 [Oscillospiraceae bacterium]|nr:hypothetical protein [Oscillospiraceae bacterium]